MDILKLNDKVSWKGNWGSEEPETVRVVSIEINCNSKYGDNVDQVEWSKVNDRSVIVDLDNGHWAYGFQISKP